MSQLMETDSISYRLSCILLLFAAGLMIGCEAPEQEAESQEIITEQAASPSPFADIERAVAVVHPTAGNEASGTVLFTQSGNGIRIQAQLEGLQENGHGFHIHQYGDCTAEDGTSAGGHYNPLGMSHGDPESQERHVGDLGNITANAQGNATYNRVDTVISFDGERSIIGRAVVLHGGQDDLESQPSGAAGPRVGCGVIGVANPETSL